MATSWQELYAANKQTIGKNPNLIIPGQVLTLPDGSTYLVKKGDNLTKIANSYSSQDTTINPDEQAVLESWQAENRAKLQEEEALNNQLSSPPEVPPEEDPFEAARQQAEQESNNASPTEQDVIDSGVEPLSADEQAVLEAQQADNRARLQEEENVVTPNGSNTTIIPEPNANNRGDWRLRLSLADKADYLYNVAGPSDILYPLRGTNGVIFPYTPQIQMAYKANYDPAELTHNNYKMHFYKNSQVDDITITADFTAQDTFEANYLLAVMHFFKSATKMFYGQDINPVAGTPPPLVYLSGYGAYQFDHHPLAVSSFSYTLPNDVDYIRAGTTQTWGGTSIGRLTGTTTNTSLLSKLGRLFGNNLTEGALPAGPAFNGLGVAQATYVPTKIQVSITLLPIVTRRNISTTFSLRDYATGKLLQGSKQSGGGIW